MKSLIKSLWNKTKEGAARLFRTSEAQRVIVITRVIYMWKPSLTIRSRRIAADVAAAHGQIALF